LVTGYGWNFGMVFAAVMVGSLAGAMTAFWLGCRVERRRQDRKRERGADSPRGIVDDIVERFQRRGPAILIINRFLPGLRALVFVAAGMAGLGTRAVLLYAALSAALWNLAIMAVGVTLGTNLDALSSLVATYTVWAFTIMVCLVVAMIAVFLWRRHQRGKDRR
jgi:membrane protein DedA with SNARE-associated domain